MLKLEWFFVEPRRKILVTPTASVLPAICLLLFFFCLKSTWTDWNLLFCWQLTVLEEEAVSFGFAKFIWCLLFLKQAFLPPKLLSFVFWSQHSQSFHIDFQWYSLLRYWELLGLIWFLFSWTLSVVWRPYFRKRVFKSHNNICISPKDFL